jgi:hypothetical protein
MTILGTPYLGKMTSGNTFFECIALAADKKELPPI